MNEPEAPAQPGGILSGALTGGARTIVEILRRRAEVQPDLRIFTFLGASVGENSSRTLSRLSARTRAIALALDELGLRGERALLLYPPGLDFVEAFYGCLEAGVVAVPAFPPRPNRTLERLATIAADAGAVAALAPAGSIARAREIAETRKELTGLRWIATDKVRHLEESKGSSQRNVITGNDVQGRPSAPGSGPHAVPIAGDPRRETLAYLQYTSGSTSDPKGVMVAHENLMANSEAIRLGFEHGPESRSLSWLPHYHDMGLVDGIVQPVYAGFPAVLMSPTYFLQSPARWLEAIAEHRITHSGGPNFAYDLCARRVDPDPGRIDLRSWSVAYNGAEPVRAETLDRFAAQFISCGFRREAFYPAYGLAEATLKVSGGKRNAGPVVVRVGRQGLEAGRVEIEEDVLPPSMEHARPPSLAEGHIPTPGRHRPRGEPTRRLVGSGHAGPGTRVAIVDPDSGCERGESEVGEIWVSGPGVALGYWNRKEDTERTFGARIARGNDDEPPGQSGARFLRTGDLGFARGGEIFVTGRLKDLVIVRGRNLYPQDIERTAESCHVALRPGCGAAFGVEPNDTWRPRPRIAGSPPHTSSPEEEADEERLVVVHEIDRHGADDPASLIATIRAAIVEAHEVDPGAIVLVRPGGVPRTSSGKVQRGACRRAFLDGSLPLVAEWRAPTLEGSRARSAVASGAASERRAAGETALRADTTGGEPLDAHRWIAERVAEKLGVSVSTIDLHIPLARLGLDSLRSIELAHEIERRFGTSLTATDLLLAPSLAAIATRLGPGLDPTGAEVSAKRAAGSDPAAMPAAPDHREETGPLSQFVCSAVPEAPCGTDAPVRRAADRGERIDDATVDRSLSVGQRALWFLHETAPEAGAYTIAAALRLAGPLDDAALEEAARALVERHASLRARILAPAGEPSLRFDVPFDAIWSRRDLRGSRPEDLPARLADLAYEPFDLAAGPLVRLALVRCGSDRAPILLVSAHHAVADLWSLSLVLRDLRELYAMAVQKPAAAPHPAEFVRWQEHLLSGDEGERQFAFWRWILAGEIAPLHLPADRPRPSARSFRGGSRARALDPELAAALRGLARERDVTLFTLLLAGYQAFLGRIAGQVAISVGVPASGRTNPRFAGLVGYLVNSVVLRADLSSDPTFDDLLRGTRESVLGAMANQDYPFATLVRRLVPPREPGRSPLFDTMFDFHATGDLVRGDMAVPGRRAPGHHAPLEEETGAPWTDPSTASAARAGFPGDRFAGGVVAEPIEIERRWAQFDLSVTVTESGPGGNDLSVEYEYAADLFDAGTIDNFASSFEALLAGAAADPSRRISRLPLLSPRARAAAFRAGNARPAPSPIDCVHRLIARRAARRPEAIAVWHGRTSLTYGALDRRANAVARRLREAGVGPETRVGVAVEKSADLIVALLGVLKAGGAYVPIEPSLPAARRRFLIEDSGARVVLARSSGAGSGHGREPGSGHEAGPDREPRPGRPAEDSPGPVFGPDVLVLDDREWAAHSGDGHDGEDLPDGAGCAVPGNLAYILYTSGTTGTPKGVGVTHAGLVGAYHAWDRLYDLGSLGTHLQAAAFGFDVFAGDLVRALGSGGALALADRDTLLDPPALAALIRERRTEFVDIVPGAFRPLAEHLASAGERLDSFRIVVVGADAWTMADHSLFTKVLGPRTRLHNSYGVTEATVDSTSGEVLAEDSRRSAPPIGPPLANTALHVLGADLEPRPDGIPGEIWLGGPAVARGYHGRPDLTAERFLPDLHGEPGARLYRTGDLARRLADGRIEFLGRADAQVKIRGQRIEPAEVEAVLASHPAVRAAAVVARERGGLRAVDGRAVAGGASPGQLRLVAYVVLGRLQADAGRPSGGRGDGSGTPAADAGSHPRLGGARDPALPETRTVRASGRPEAVAERGAPVAALRAWLAERLPEPMIPSAFVVLDELPLSPNGKVDRRALPEPSWERPAERGALTSEVQEPGAPRPRSPSERLERGPGSSSSDANASSRASDASAPSAPDSPGSPSVPSSPTHAERALAHVWRQVLGVGAVAPEDDFFALGGDSILGIQVVARAREAGLHLTPRMIFEHTTLTALARAAERPGAVQASRPESLGAAAPRAQEQSPGPEGSAADLADIPDVSRVAPGWSGETPMTPIQRWFFGQDFTDPAWWNMAVALDARDGLDPGLASRAASALVDHHDALRARFERGAKGWRQVIGPSGAGRAGGPGARGNEPTDAATIDLLVSRAGAGEDRETAVARCAGVLNASLDLERGPLVRFGIVTGGSGADVKAPARSAAPAHATLLLVAHHLVVDGVSLRILVEDFQRAYRQAQSGNPIVLPARTAHAGVWAAALEEAVRSGQFEEEIGRARRLAERWIVIARAPDSDESGTESVTKALDGPATARVLAAAAAAGASVEDLLLAALATSWAGWADCRALLVEVEGHGRGLLPELDLSRTVGWFTATRPLLVEEIDPAKPASTLEAVRCAGRDGPGHALLALRWLSSHPATAATLGRLPVPEVSFNYLGRFDAAREAGSLFEAVREPAAPPRSPRSRPAHALEIDASVAGGSLSTRWTFARARFDRETVERLAAGFRNALASIASLDAASAVTGDRPSGAASGPETSAAFNEHGEPAPSGGGKDRRLSPGTGTDTGADTGTQFGTEAGAEAVLPLTPMQEGMLFHHLRGAGQDPYVSQIVLELTGEIDAGVLARAWRHAFEVHPALRAAFLWEGRDRPVQVIRRVAPLPIAIRDGDSPAIEELRRSARAEGFDLARAPLARVDLVRAGPRRTTAIFTHHHILLDGWSLPIVLGTVLDAYDALIAGRPAPKPTPEGVDANALPTALSTLSRYVTAIASHDGAEAERFFRDHLAGLSRPTPTPDTGEERGEAGTGSEAGAAGQPGSGTGCGIVRAAEQADLAARARALGLTPSTVVQAGWALVLAASSGERDVVFGATSSGRAAGAEGVESLVGLFINTLPVRTRVDPRATARTWMAELQRLGARLRQHEHAPLALVQRAAAAMATPARTSASGRASRSSSTPLFETLLVFENYPIDVAALGRRAHFSITDVRVHEETNYPLTIVASDEGGWRLRAIYDRSRYDETGARLVLARLTAAIEGLLSRPGAALGEIRVLAPTELRRMREWNETERGYPRDATIVEVFERVAHERAEEAALVWEGGSATYAALRSRALVLARAFEALGVGPESRVALALERSPALVEAILGVLYAGGAYVPIDVDSPPERTARMLARSGVRLIVTDGRRGLRRGNGSSGWSFGGSFQVVPLADLDRTQPPPTLAAPEEAMDRRSRTGEAPEAQPRRAGPDSLAYTMFTSGSTGEPKGIEVTHRNVLRLVLGVEYARLGPGETILQLAPAGFDASTFEIWGTLLTGGRLAIAPPGAAAPAEIARLIDQLGATTVFLTTGLFHVVVDEEPAALARVGQVLTGGDVLSPARIASLLDAGCPRLIVCYGPTETTTYATCDPLAPGDAVGERVTLGRPIANVRAHVLDAGLRPVPIGAPGELCLGGDGVARGYADRPDLTAEQFVPDPFGPPGSRLYRTGDLARWRADGRLDFLGRSDGQVKVRGFRVEIAEVEAALAAAPGVRAAAVVARADGEGARDLVGYVVLEDDAALGSNALGDGDPGDTAQASPRVAPGGRATVALREALAGSLPRYMIPPRIVVLDRLPLTASGKIDRRALPEPTVGALETGGPVRDDRPMTAVEEAVADLWRRVLGVRAIGPEDDFFELGGHSLHAMRVLSAVRRSFRIDLPMSALFEATTVAGLARALFANEPEPGHVDRAVRAIARLRAARLEAETPDAARPDAAKPEAARLDAAKPEASDLEARRTESDASRAAATETGGIPGGNP